jgi:DNA end-binding protein Ku
MPRSLWTGSLSFGLVNVPVQVFSAARDLDYHFRQLHEKDQVPIEQRRFCSKEDVEVPWEEVARSHELEKGRKKGTEVIVTDEELAAAEPRKTRTIDIEAFVDLDEVDPIYFDHPYLLAPAGDSEGTLRAYRLLVKAMESSERVALGRFVMRTKEYLVAVAVRDGVLALTTMRFHDEVRSTKDVPTGGRKPAKKAVDHAVAIIEELSTEWEPERYTDCYRKRLKRVIDDKRKGKTIKAPKPMEEPSGVPDLMAALQATLENVRGGGNGRSAAAEAEDDGGEDLRDLSREELYERAQDAGVPGRSKMSKDELADALSG